MNEEDKIIILLSRINGVLVGLVEALQPFLASKNDTSGQSRESVAAFNTISRQPVLSSQ